MPPRTPASPACRRLLQQPRRPVERAGLETEAYPKMVERIRKRLGLTSLRHVTLGATVEAIGVPGDSLCTCCWIGASRCENALGGIARGGRGWGRGSGPVRPRVRVRIASVAPR